MYSILCRTIIAVTLFGGFPAYADEPNAQAQSSGAIAEAEYFKMRDTFRQQSANEAHDSEKEDRAVAILKEQIKAVIGPMSVKGFGKEGRPTIRIISNDPCCDQIDALVFSNSSEEVLFITTKGLVDNYVLRHPDQFKGMEGAIGTEQYYFSTITSPSKITNYADIPVKSSNGKYFMKAFLGVFANEGVMSYSPDKIFIYISDGSHLIMLSAPTKIEEIHIPECHERYNDYDVKACAARQSYFDSDKQYPQFMDVADLLQNTGFKALYTCYQRKSKNMPFFVPLVKQAQSMVDRIPLK